jgi:2-dehydropantoate 2-reductase
VTIAANEKCHRCVLVGNNPTAIQMQEYIHQNSKIQKEFVFAFQSVGGRREGEKIISIHAKSASALTLGTLNGVDSYKDILEKVFERTQLTLDHHKDINAMLISHIAFILPLVFACYAYNGNLRLAFKKADIRHKVIKAIDEGFRVVESNGLTATPASQVELVRVKQKKTSLLLKLVAYTPLGRLAISDHAMAAKDEMYALAMEFENQRNNSEVKTPNWIELEQYIY